MRKLSTIINEKKQSNKIASISNEQQFFDTIHEMLKGVPGYIFETVQEIANEALKVNTNFVDAMNAIKAFQQGEI